MRVEGRERRSREGERGDHWDLVGGKVKGSRTEGKEVGL